MIENEPKFCEVQRFRPWVRWFIILLVLVVVPIEVMVLRAIKTEQQDINVWLTFLLIGVGIVVPLLVAILFFMIKLETQVRADGLYVRMFPLHLRFREFKFDSLEQYNARTYRPIMEYGGWGIRFGKSGKVYNMSGNKGVQLVFKNGKRLLIGSQRAEELAGEIGAAANKS